MDAAGQRFRDHIGPRYQQVLGDKVAGPGLSLQHAMNLRSARSATEQHRRALNRA